MRDLSWDLSYKYGLVFINRFNNKTCRGIILDKIKGKYLVHTNGLLQEDGSWKEIESNPDDPFHHIDKVKVNDVLGYTDTRHP